MIDRMHEDWYARPSAAVAFCVGLEALLSDEGNSVNVLSADPEAETTDRQHAIEVTAEWTSWQPRRFYGQDPLAAILAAGREQALAR